MRGIAIHPPLPSDEQDEPERGVDPAEFVEAELTDFDAEPAGVHRGGLLGKNKRREPADSDFWPKGGRSGGRGGWGHQPGREGEQVGLNDDGIAVAELLVPLGVAW